MTDRIELHVDRDGWTKGLQVNLVQLAETNHGMGYRLAGPKYNGSSRNLLTARLDERDAREIRQQLDAVFPQAQVIYRASHESIVMGLYATAAAAREHCEDVARRERPVSVADLRLFWREDEDTVNQPEDGEAELIDGTAPHASRPTGYVVTPLTAAAEYDPEAES